MKNIYIIRHGQTDYNLKGIVQGSGVNASLNELGKKQAKAFYEQFRHVPFDKVYTSKLLRTHQSVESFSNITPTEQHEGLNEISWGRYEGLEVNDNDRLKFKEMIDFWRKGNLDIAFEKGESPLQVAERQKRFIPKLYNSDEKNVLVCMHGRAMRIFLCQLLNLPLIHMDKYKHSNLCLYQVKLSKDKTFRLVKENYTGHLQSL